MHKSLIILFFFMLIKSSFAIAQDAEFIWAEDDQSGSRIYLSQHKNGAWQTPEKIVDDSNLNILPGIGSDSKGQRLAVWTMVNAEQSVLRYSSRKGGNWSVPQTLSTQFSTNLGPMLVFDVNNVGWLFWTANNGNDDDIYLSRYSKGLWSTPEMVNDDNDVPDILPEAGQDDNGNIWVTWQQLQENAYIDKTRSYEVSSHRKMAQINALTAENIKLLKLRSNLNNTIKPPAFFKARSRATMYFPNKKRSSMPVKGNLN